jgi:hypothetical protein
MVGTSGSANKNSCITSARSDSDDVVRPFPPIARASAAEERESVCVRLARVEYVNSIMHPFTRTSKVRIEHFGRRVARVVKQVLPLSDHSLKIVVDDKHLDPDFVL